ncbi:MAG TPA: hypothetical protein VF789_06180 [Thermoanaerobaculia bacterium]
MKRRVLLLVVLASLICAACGVETPSPGAAPPKPSGKGTPGSAKAAQPPLEMELRRWEKPRELVRIRTRGVSIGPADGPLAWKFFSDPGRADEAWYFLRTYAPFQMRFVQGELAFRGRGKVKPGVAEQRMILEWARRTAAEAAESRSAAAYGLVLAWHRGGTSGNCEDLALYLTGEAVATSCGVTGEVRGRLEPGQLGRVFSWFDQIQAFQAGQVQENDSRSGSLQTRLIFAGRGIRPATPREQTEIQSFAGALYAELAARRLGGAPPVPTPPPGKPGTKPEIAAETPPQRLLLPPDFMKPRPQGPVLQLPEKPPPPPKGPVGEGAGAVREPSGTL